MEAAAADRDGWRKLEYLCDRIGARLAGSASLTRAFEWAAGEMRREGFARVETPLVKVPRWVRGRESAAIVEPLASPLVMLGLGNSIGTPTEGITAEAVVAESFDHLEKLGAERVRGKIVVYNVPWEGYGKTVAYRSAGASRAARLGAVAALMRPAGIAVSRTPHTGMLSYAADAPRIPAACISLEDALRIARLTAAGNRVRVQLKMEAQMLPDADSANLIADLPGSEKPGEIVLLGGHLDSWDVGQGAHDDGGGCVACWQAVTLIRRLGLRPRRTIRLVLFTNEENGLRGGRAYAEWAGETVKNHVAAIENDGGIERLAGFGVSGNDAALERVRAITAPLAAIGAAEVTAGGGGSDIGPITRLGVPGISPRTAGGRYFEWHHTDADTLDKIAPEDFRKHVAGLAVLVYGLANMPGRLAE
jgi:Iap family predicted aminopeptidase